MFSSRRCCHNWVTWFLFFFFFIARGYLAVVVPFFFFCVCVCVCCWTEKYALSLCHLRVRTSNTCARCASFSVFFFSVGDRKKAREKKKKTHLKRDAQPSLLWNKELFRSAFSTPFIFFYFSCHSMKSPFFFFIRPFDYEKNKQTNKQTNTPDSKKKK